jgi:undecaprenyl-diphosphatase
MEKFWLALIQGITEFLPVSSSTHLEVFSKIFNLSSFGRTTDVALNLITVLVVLIYFRTYIIEMALGICMLLKGRITADLQKFLKICVATIPTIIMGYVVHVYWHTDSPLFQIMGWSSIIFGVFLMAADRYGRLDKTYKKMTYRDAILIGCFQMVSLIPGASRLGSTLIMGRILGYQRTDAATFSFLLSLPVSIGAGALLFKEILESHQFVWGMELCLIAGVTFIVGYFALGFFIWWLKKRTLLLWGLYRILFGTFILWYLT